MRYVVSLKMILIFCFFKNLFSRQACGPVTEANAVLLFHVTSCPPAQLPVLLAVAKGLVEEQFANITSFNVVRYVNLSSVIYPSMKDIKLTLQLRGLIFLFI